MEATKGPILAQLRSVHGDLKTGGHTLNTKSIKGPHDTSEDERKRRNAGLVWYWVETPNDG